MILDHGNTSTRLLNTPNGMAGRRPTSFFPFFLFIVGVSMTLSFASRVARWPVTRRALAIHVVRRSALIFAIGLFLNGFPDFDLSTIRIMGVLQRIALCYLFGGFLYLFVSRRKTGTNADTQSLSGVAVIAAVVVILLVGYWALMTFVPVPGYGAPGTLPRIENLGAYLDRTHSWAATCGLSQRRGIPRDFFPHFPPSRLFC